MIIKLISQYVALQTFIIKSWKILIIGEDKSQIDTLNDLLWTFEIN